jgi:hypothetical protein
MVLVGIVSVRQLARDQHYAGALGLRLPKGWCVNVLWQPVIQPSNMI